MARELWTVQNVTTKEVTIGDLFQVPSIPAGKTIDLLKFHKTQEINQSSNLHQLLNMGWLTLVKTSTVKNPVPHTIEEDELNQQTDLNIVKTTSDFTISSITRIWEIILANAVNNNITVNVPNAALNTNHRIYIKKIDTSFHVITVTGTIDKGSTKIITRPFDTMRIISDGTEWWIT